MYWSNGQFGSDLWEQGYEIGGVEFQNPLQYSMGSEHCLWIGICVGFMECEEGSSVEPQHQGDELIWRGSTAVPAGFECEYSYYVVDDDRNVLRWEAGKKRKLVLPDGLKDGEVVELRDLWQTSSDGLPCTSAFTNVIFRKTWSTEI